MFLSILDRITYDTIEMILAQFDPESGKECLLSNAWHDALYIIW
jgi:hypothetical protein